MFRYATGDNTNNCLITNRVWRDFVCGGCITIYVYMNCSSYCHSISLYMNCHILLLLLLLLSSYSFIGWQVNAQLPIVLYACNTSVDCPQPIDWCTLSYQCDINHHTCVAWPRCKSYPFLGCEAGKELCVSILGESFIDGSEFTHDNIRMPTMSRALLYIISTGIGGFALLIVLVVYYSSTSSSTSEENTTPYDLPQDESVKK